MFSDKGMIFDIQHFSIQDGPGIRSTIFFKGCPLRCKWCSNPESQSASPQMLHYSNLCKGCGACIDACPQHLIFMKGNGPGRKTGCTACGACAAVCRNTAHVLSGRMVTVAQVCEEVREHWQIFMQSGGGVTCGGGEPLFQPLFLKALLTEVHEKLGFSTCMETCGMAAWGAIEEVLPVLDMLYLDLKHMDARLHKAATGQDNARILDNAQRLARRNIPVIIRLPLIAGYNDTDANLNRTGEFMKSAGLGTLEIMPQHHYGKSKYEALGKAYEAANSLAPRIDVAVAVLGGYGIDVGVHES